MSNLEDLLASIPAIVFKGWFVVFSRKFPGMLVWSMMRALCQCVLGLLLVEGRIHIVCGYTCPSAPVAVSRASGPSGVERGVLMRASMLKVFLKKMSRLGWLCRRSQIGAPEDK